MTASKVRADYEQLAEIAQAFGQQAETAQRVLGALQKDTSALQGGDWVGKGADAFYAEMNSAVLPAMKRLVAAMNQAATTTTKISRIMKQAENDAAAIFKAQSNGSREKAGFVGASGTVSGAAVSGQANVRRLQIGERKVVPSGGLLSSIGGFFGSAARFVGDFVVGAASEVAHMAKAAYITSIAPWYTAYQMAKGLWFTVNNPRETWEAFKKPYVDAWKSGHPGEAIGRASIFFGSIVFGGGEAEVAAEVGIASREVELAVDAAKAAKAAEAVQLAEMAKAGRGAKAAEGASAAGKTGKAGEVEGAVAKQEKDLAEAAKAGEAEGAAPKVNRMDTPRRPIAEVKAEQTAKELELEGVKTAAKDFVEEQLGLPPSRNLPVGKVTEKLRETLEKELGLQLKNLPAERVRDIVREIAETEPGLITPAAKEALGFLDEIVEIQKRLAELNKEIRGAN